MAMPFPNTTGEYIRQLYESKHREIVRSEIERIIPISKDTAPLQYYCCVLFYDIPCDKQFPTYFMSLLSSYSYTAFLIREHIGVDLTEAEFNLSRMYLQNNGHQEESGVTTVKYKEDTHSTVFRPLRKTQDSHITNSMENYAVYNEDEDELRKKRFKQGIYRSLGNSKLNKRLLSFLFKIERQFHEMVKLDKPFIEALFESLEETVKNKILSSSRVTPQKIHLSSFHKCKHDFYTFCELENVDSQMAFEKGTGLQHRTIKKIILRSSFEFIKSKLPFFYRVFPELKTFGGFVSENRVEFRKNPEKISMDIKILRTYVQNSTQRMYFIKRILSLDHDSCMLSLINYWFFETPRLVDL
ncbi:hypothetical protein PAEPH01_2368, partial [Pancytospora epiphaga]